jgi:hypothetical protein
MHIGLLRAEMGLTFQLSHTVKEVRPADINSVGVWWQRFAIFV